MKLNHIAITIFVAILASQVFAEDNSKALIPSNQDAGSNPQAMPQKDAGGNVVVDQGGNLKILPQENGANPQPAPPKPAAMPQVQPVMPQGQMAMPQGQIGLPQGKQPAMGLKPTGESPATQPGQQMPAGQSPAIHPFPPQ